MRATISHLIKRLEDSPLRQAKVIPWSSPILAFGDVSRSCVATLGLNPSNREFVDSLGQELEGATRRFHTLKSLALRRWSDVKDCHLEQILELCYRYFHRNPYNGWFKKLDYLIGGTLTSYYSKLSPACHLDLIPYATKFKWAALTQDQRSILLKESGDTLGLVLANSCVRVLILNGQSVVKHFEQAACVRLDKIHMKEWELPRKSLGVPGFAYRGVIRSLGDIDFSKDIIVFGFNHNLQSSFGVTKRVVDAIRNWITKSVHEAL